MRNAPQDNPCVLAWGLLVAALAFPTWAASAEYVLVPAQSELVVRVYKAGPAAGLAHDHVIRATRMRGTFTGDPAQPAGATGMPTIDTAALQADEPALRAEVRPLPRLDGQRSAGGGSDHVEPVPARCGPVSHD